MKPTTTKKTPDNAKKTKAYSRFEKLLGDIEQMQVFKNNLEAGLKKASAKIDAELTPLLEEGHQLSKLFVIRLDELATEIGLGKYNREWFESYICDELDSLLDFFGHQDAELSALYQKYTGLTPGDIANDEHVLEVVESFKNMFGCEVDVEELIKKGERGYFEEHRDEFLKQILEGNQNLNISDKDDPETSEAPKAKPSKADNESAGLQKDARNVYMRLVKKFHPDLEKDPEIRKRNDDITKEVTRAYQHNDFFALLKLQIAHLEDNEAEAEAIADDMIRRYNKILQKQLNDLKKWTEEVQFSSGSMIADFIDRNGKFSAQKFASQRRQIELSNSAATKSIAESKKRPKGWFKEQIAGIKQVVQQTMMEDIMLNMFGDF